MTDGQLPLEFPHTPLLTEAGFLPRPGTQLALEFLGSTDAWPDRRLALWGGPGTGKTHLLHIWARERGAAIIAGPSLHDPFWPEGAIAVDDADQAPSEQAMLHLLNAAAEAAHPLLLAAPDPPGRFRVGLPDLASRLRATIAVEIGPADEAFLAALLTRLLADRQLPVTAALQAWILTRLPRSPAAVRDAVAQLDYAALAAKSGVTRKLAADALADLFEDETVTEASP